MDSGLTGRQWEILLSRISDGNCTPVIGFGACDKSLPSPSEMAQAWARTHNTPVESSQQLHRVAQYLAVDDPFFPQEDLAHRWYDNLQPPDFQQIDEPHALLAKLPLPVYITSNYDDFMSQALRHCHRDPRPDTCRWKSELLGDASPFDDAGFSPSAANPVVFHLYGRASQPRSIVLTEDDYFDFLVSVSRDEKVLPPRIQRALNGSSLVFIGYDPADLGFRVLFRGLVASTKANLRRISITVQLPAVTGNTAAKAAQRRFLEEYFSKLDMRVYWGTVRDFANEMRRRCHDAGILK